MTRRLLTAALALATAVTVAAPAAAARPALPSRDPGYDVGRTALAAALHCPAVFAHSSREPVLLVHGTGLTPQESWA